MTDVNPLSQAFINAARGTFLEQDRDSNFPPENSIAPEILDPPEYLIGRWFNDWARSYATWCSPRFDRFDQIQYVCARAARWGAAQGASSPSRPSPSNHDHPISNSAPEAPR